MPEIYAIIVTYNGIRWLDRCIGSLLESETPVHVVIIDNASTDGSVEYVKLHYSNVFIIENKDNLGFAKSNNIGIRYAIDHGADYVFLLNQDAWVEKSTLTELVKSFEENDHVGIASPIHLNGSYSALDHGFCNYMGLAFTSDAFLGKLKKFYDRSFINAAAWLVCRQCIEVVGGFDTMLFKHYGEDVNYCQRAIYHGFRIIVNTHCTICHDREERIERDLKKETISRKTFCLSDRITYGDINTSFDFKRVRSEIKRKMYRSIFLGRFKSYRLQKERLALFETIEKSRRINENKCSNWI